MNKKAMEMAPARKKKIRLAAIGGVMAVTLLAVALNASWVEDVLNPIPPEELAEIEKAFEDAAMVLNADVAEVIELTPEEQEAIYQYAAENNMDAIKFSHLLLIESATDYKNRRAIYRKEKPYPFSMFVEKSEDCSVNFIKGTNILYVTLNKSNDGIPYRHLPSRIKFALKNFHVERKGHINLEELGAGWQWYAKCFRSGPVEEQIADDMYGKRNREKLDSTSWSVTSKTIPSGL